MRARRSDPDLQAAVTRRLALLSSEIGGHPPPGPSGPSAPPDVRTVPGPAVLPGLPGRHAARRRAALRLLPRTPPGFRLALGPRTFSALSILVACGLSVTTWWAVQGRPQELRVEEIAREEIADSTGPTTQESGAEPTVALAAGAPADVVVDVSGRVRRPGIAVLPAGARVADALEAAGGARRSRDLNELNLARRLIDGEQILVGLPSPSGVGAAAAAAPAGTSGAGPLVNVNTADQAELETLPGVGPVTALAIISRRSQHGGFGAVEELLDVQGIGEATLAQLAPYVTV